MGQDLENEQTPEVVRSFTRALLRDLQALEYMLDEGMIESGVRRIGAEQEMFLVGRGWRAAPKGVEVLERLGDPFTPELARFNLEVNLEPMLLEGDVFRRLEARLVELVDQAREAAQEEGAEIALTGILPTLSKSDLTLDNITPRKRYYALNDALNRMRGGEAYRLRIEGTDELHVQHDSVMLESANTSCQVHLQVSHEEFACMYNVAQAVIGPVLAAAVNSPLLFAKRLWAETRIALFQQSLDTRSATLHMRDVSPRVRFGDRWVENSVVDLFQEDIARFRVLLATHIEEDPQAVLKAGGIPKLQALQMNNSTVYRWNRPCYGISEGKPHLRIECRALPSGPTIVDEVANAAFWIGAVLGVADEYGDITEVMDFDDVKTNCHSAAKLGLNAAMVWAEDKRMYASELICEVLLPLARKGLRSYGVVEEDIDRYLGVIEDRVESGQTGSSWMIRSLAHMKGRGTRSERLAAVTAASVRLQKEGSPVHEWPLAELEEAGGWKQNYLRVEQYMTTHLFTVHEDELVELVAFLMDRKQIRHVLVEDDDHRLVGLVSYRSVLRLVAEASRSDSMQERPVKEIMDPHPVAVSPETPTLEAIQLMREHKVSCLPVVKDEKLVGIVSERDFMPIANQLLEERLREEEE
jgi:CBS domain-containing protein